MQEVLGLSKEQKEQMLAHRHVKLVSLARLVQERRELQARLQAGTRLIAFPFDMKQACLYVVPPLAVRGQAKAGPPESIGHAGATAWDHVWCCSSTPI